MKKEKVSPRSRMFHGVLDEVDNGVALELGKTTKTKVSWEKKNFKTFYLILLNCLDFAMLLDLFHYYLFMDLFSTFLACSLFIITWTRLKI